MISGLLFCAASLTPERFSYKVDRGSVATMITANDYLTGHFEYFVILPGDTSDEDVNKEIAFMRRTYRPTVLEHIEMWIKSWRRRP